MVSLSFMRVERWFEPSDGMELVVRLLNSWDELEPEPELLRDPEIAALALRRHGFDDAAALADVRELAALRDLRSRLRAAWDAGSDASAVALLNELLAECKVQPRLERQGRGWAFRWDAPGLRASAFAPGLCASALLQEIEQHGRRRLGTCAGTPCRCVFMDRSKNRSRRYCCDQCADRVNQAAHRRRLRH
jgi:predicted RNA-binding Zn ribbon-like protein